MLFLILAHGHEIAVVDQYIRRHQDGISEQTDVRHDAVGGLVLIAVAVFQHRHWRDRAKNPCELRMLRNIALLEENGLLGIEATSKEING